MKKKQILLQKHYFLLFFLAMSLSTYAVDINYNQARNNFTGSEANRLQQVINGAAAGDVIIFNSTSYDFNNGFITINRGIELRGLSAGAGFNANFQGASAVRTIFNNVGRIVLRSNNIGLTRLDIRGTTPILIDGRHPNYVDDANDDELSANLSSVYTNLNINNCFLRAAGTYGIHGGNGLGGSLNQVTCINFTFAALNFDRKGPVNDLPVMNVNRCRFQPANPVDFNDWAISYDAGNSGYPVVWNANNSRIQNSTFINTGVAYSRTRNGIVNNCTFNHNVDRNIQLVHVEEFSENIDIIDNTFNANTPGGITNVIGLDREIQPINNVDILRNTINGRFNHFIEGYSNNNVTINNNIFGTTAECTGRYTIDLEFHETNFLTERVGNPQFPQNPSNGIVIQGNQRLMQPAVTGRDGVIHIWLRNGNGGLNTNVADGLITRRNAQTGPPQLIPDGTYFIQNSQGRIQDFQTTPRIVSSTASGDLVRWRVRQVSPSRYTIQNVATDHYLEARRVISDSPLCRGLNPNYSPIATFNWTNLETMRPRWLIQRFNANEFVVYPGGNEIKSMLSTAGGAGTNTILANRLQDGTPNDANTCPRAAIDLNNFSNNRFRWSFVNVSEAKAVNEKLEDEVEEIGVFPTFVSIGEFLNVKVRKDKVSTINAYDLSGRLVLTRKAENDLSIPTSSFTNSNGIFIFEITSEEGDLVTQKILIK